MTTSLKLTQIGNSVGLILPKELLVRLDVDKGDTLHATFSPTGLHLSPYDPAIAEELEVGREFMKAYRDTFRALAK